MSKVLLPAELKDKLGDIANFIVKDGRYMAGIQDVAKKAGVSIGTVSRVLNHSGYASEASRKKVEQAVKELHYRPNEVARNLLQKQTKIVAMIVPDVANPFFSELVSDCEKELRNQGYKTMICNTNGHKSNELAYLDMLNRHLVDGILTCTHSLKQEKYKETEGAIVSFDTIYVPGKISRISANHAEGGRMAANALLRSGCKKILQMRDREPEEHYPFLERHETFEKTIRDAGAECINIVVKWNEFEDSYYETLARECFEKYPDADGVFGVDANIFHYMRYVQEMGKKIPDDIKFVSYDGTIIRDMIYPRVSCIRQPIDKLAEKGVEVLLRKINGEETENEIVFPVEYVKGMTTTED